MKSSKSPLFHAFACVSSSLRTACSASFGTGAARSSRSAIMVDSPRDLGGRNSGVVGQPLMDAVAVDFEGEVGRPRRGLELQISRHARVAVVLQHSLLGVEDAGTVGDTSVP